MNEGDSKLNASSLIDLKAELHKKYEAFRNVKLQQQAVQTPKGTNFKIKGEIAKEKKIKPKTVHLKEVNVEEELTLKKSREALEAKSKLYENIVSNNILIDDEQKDNYLVDFQRKVLYESPVTNSGEKSETGKSSNIRFVENLMSQTTSPTGLSSQQTPEVQDPDQPIHYQNVQYNEVRDHGTAYFSFSMDEKKRREQMEELKTLRQKTEEERKKHEKIQQKRNAVLQARLKKICERKNIDQSVIDSYTKPSTSETEFTTPLPDDISTIPLPEKVPESETNEPKEKKQPKIRPWDIGKNNLQHFVPAKKIKTQEQWVEERREERPMEFAPPSSYSKKHVY